MTNRKSQANILVDENENPRFTDFGISSFVQNVSYPPGSAVQDGE